MSLALQYGSAFAIFVAVDLIWLGLVAKSFYHRELSALIADKFNLWAAAAFYLLYPIGIVVFAAAPASATGSALHAMGLGAALGFFAYATYDLTNLATLRNWPLKLTIVDMLWGTFLTALTSGVAFYAGRMGT
jgi:uncharacterized membrane protein